MEKYVEASAMIEKMRQMAGTTDYNSDSYKVGYHLAMIDAAVMLESAPLADVAPVRHEHWIPVKFADSQWLINDGVLCLTDGFLCGSCGYEAIEKFPYCPRCGARMNAEN